MFIKPNEFEKILAAKSRTQSPAARFAAGSLYLILLVPVRVVWFGVILTAATGVLASRIVRNGLRLVGGAAEHAGLLIVG